MYSESAIEVVNLSKCYHIYEQPHHRLRQLFALNGKRFYKEFWALKDISFKLNKGETVGIIGSNGSGKSTLLQLICGTLNASDGEVKTSGRIAALLELGSGFNPEFTGRENIFLYASILGLNEDEIKARFEEIIAFAAIGEFIDQPIKTYSSGMIIRLAFAVAINVDPQILIVYEALSVGDERFQRKCFSKIEAMQKNGTTILFVSHSASTIVELCNRAILLDHGELLASGPPKNIVAAYHKLLYSSPDQRDEYRNVIKSDGDRINIPPEIAIEVGSLELEEHSIESYSEDLVSQSVLDYESRGATISEIAIQTLDGRLVNNLVRGRRYKYTYQVRFSKQCNGVRFGMLIKGINGHEYGGSSSPSLSSGGIEIVDSESRWNVTFVFACNLAPGTYYLNAGVVGFLDEEESYLHRLIDATVFKVQPEKNLKMTGVVDFQIDSIIQCEFD